MTLSIAGSTTVDRENFVGKKVTWDKSLTRFNFVKSESIACTSTKELRMLVKNFHEFLLNIGPYEICLTMKFSQSIYSIGKIKHKGCCQEVKNKPSALVASGSMLLSRNM